MVRVGVCGDQHDRLRRDGRYDLVQVGNIRARVNQHGPLCSFHQIQTLVGHQAARAYPSVFVNLTEHDVVIAGDLFSLYLHCCGLPQCRTLKNRNKQNAHCQLTHKTTSYTRTPKGVKRPQGAADCREPFRA